MKMLVVGANGQIGRLLVPMLIADGHPVAVSLRNPAQAPEFEQLGANRRRECHPRFNRRRKLGRKATCVQNTNEME